MFVINDIAKAVSLTIRFCWLCAKYKILNGLRQFRSVNVKKAQDLAGAFSLSRSLIQVYQVGGNYCANFVARKTNELAHFRA